MLGGEAFGINGLDGLGVALLPVGLGEISGMGIHAGHIGGDERGAWRKQRGAIGITQQGAVKACAWHLGVYQDGHLQNGLTEIDRVKMAGIEQSALEMGTDKHRRGSLAAVERRGLGLHGMKIGATQRRFIEGTLLLRRQAEARLIELAIDQPCLRKMRRLGIKARQIAAAPLGFAQLGGCEPDARYATLRERKCL